LVVLIATLRTSLATSANTCTGRPTAAMLARGWIAPIPWARHVERRVKRALRWSMVATVGSQTTGAPSATWARDFARLQQTSDQRPITTT